MDKLKSRISLAHNIIDQAGNTNDSKKSPYHKNYNKLMALKNIYKGRKAVIFSCGESLHLYKHYAKYFVENGYIIICIKGAINHITGIYKICDFQVNNFCNELQYDYNPDHKPITLYCIKKIHPFGTEYVKGRENIPHGIKNPYDIYMTHKGADINHNILTNMIQNKDLMSFEKIFDPDKNNMTHLWGDIIYEQAIPLCTLLGINLVYVIGWDWKNLQPENNNHNRSGQRGGLDNLQITASEYLAPFLKHHFNLTLKLIGKHSSLNIPTIDIHHIIEQDKLAQ